MTTSVVILAGGQGTRLRPYTTVFPKALVPLGDMPVLEVLLRQLKSHGFVDVTLAVGHLASLIQSFFGDGSNLGLTIRYAFEDQPLGTAGPLRTIPDLPEHFLVMNADVVSTLNFRALFSTHQHNQSLATIAVYHRPTPIDFGVLELSQAFEGSEVSPSIVSFVEKPTLYHWVSMGVYAFSRDIQNLIPAHQPFGFDQLMLSLLAHNQPPQAYPFKGYWLDIGRVEDYEQAVNDFMSQRERLLPS